MALNEKPQKGGPAPVEALLHGTAAPLQLQVVTTDELLKPDCGRNGNILLPAPTCLSVGGGTRMGMALEDKSSSLQVVGTFSALGPWSTTRLTCHPVGD